MNYVGPVRDYIFDLLDLLVITEGTDLGRICTLWGLKPAATRKKVTEAVRSGLVANAIGEAGFVVYTLTPAGSVVYNEGMDALLHNGPHGPKI